MHNDLQAPLLSHCVLINKPEDFKPCIVVQMYTLSRAGTMETPFEDTLDMVCMDDILPTTSSPEPDSPQQKKKKARRRGPRLTGVSKQRRLANARERNRVHILNMNIQVLRELIPLPPQEKEPTKTEIIWMAAKYIALLGDMLDQEPIDFGDCVLNDLFLDAFC